MTPAELITRKLMAALPGHGANVQTVSLLVEALEGARHEAPSSGINISVHVTGQLHEPLPQYTFTVTAVLVVSLDDDKGGALFVDNYNALWSCFDHFARGSNCTALGDEDDDVETHIFAVDGFQLTESSEPEFADDENGGSWSASISATITGRAT